MEYKFDTEKFKKYYEQGFTDIQIAKKLNSSKSAIQAYRKKQNLLFNRNKINLTDFQKEVIIGCLLGDSSLTGLKKTGKIKNTQKTPIFNLCHSIKQEEYFKHKYEILKNLFNGWIISDNLRKQNNKTYTEIRAKSKSSVSLFEFLDLIYVDGKRSITKELEKRFTPVSLAYMFMDDGTKADVSYNICTQSFKRDQVNLFRKILYNKFDIETTINAKNVVRIRKVSLEKFNNIVKPYIHDSMLYKLHQ